MSGVLPGTTAIIGDTVPRSGLPTDTGTAFVVGVTERGPVGEPVIVTSLTQFVAAMGGRTADGLLYDTLDVAFRRGLGRAVVARVVGPAAKVAAAAVKDGGEEGKDTLQIAASSPGAWGNSIGYKVESEEGGTFAITITYKGSVVARRTGLASNADAVAWAATTDYVRLSDLGEGNPAPAEGTLKDGSDDLEGIDSEVIAGALELFTDDLGPGQVAVPGNTSEAVHKAMLAHCAEALRTPVLDLEDSGSASALIEHALALRSVQGARQACAVAPWRTVPGLAPGTVRVVPPCAALLGAISASDRANGHPNVAVAGPQGREPYALGVTQTYTADERAELNDAGVNVAIVDEGIVTNFGFRTLVDPVAQPHWRSLAAARLMMGISAGAKRVLRRKEFATLDAQGRTRSSAEGAIVSEVVAPLYAAGAIYGETPEDACAVSVEQVTNPDDGSVGKLVAHLAAKPSPYAERVEITVTNVPLTEAL